MILSGHDSVATREIFPVLNETEPARFAEYGTWGTLSLTPPSIPQIREIRAIRGASAVPLLTADFPDFADSRPMAMPMAKQAVESQILGEPVAADGDPRV